jgi:mycofactocin precursor
MAPATAATTDESKLDPTADEQVTAELIVDELLVEEVSIDGMCGVY